MRALLAPMVVLCVACGATSNVPLEPAGERVEGCAVARGATPRGGGAEAGAQIRGRAEGEVRRRCGAHAPA